VKLVEDEAARKTVRVPAPLLAPCRDRCLARLPQLPLDLLAVQAFGKKKLKWKRIAEHFNHKSKSCRRHYTKLTGKEAPEEAE
jgi:hypothetical protein